MRYNTEALNKLASHLLNCKGRYDKLKALGNKHSYCYKVGKLKERLTEELRFWTTKGSSAQREDIERDIRYISTLLNRTDFTDQEKTRINELVKKHPIEL